MNIPSSGPKGSFESFKKSRFSMPVAFVMVLVLDMLLLWISVNSPEDACLAGILVGMISIFGFVWLGVNQPRKLAILATVIFLIMVPAYSVMYADALYSVQYPDTIDPDYYVVSEVSVDPYVGSASTQEFNFTAVVPGNATNISIDLKVMSGTNLGTLY